MGTIASQITSLTNVYSIVYSDADQRKHQTPRHWSLCGEFTRDWWNPRTNGQLRRKCFHLMTSSCLNSTCSFVVLNVISQRAMYVGPTLSQRRYCRPDVGSTLAQPSLLSGIMLCDRAIMKLDCIMQSGCIHFTYQEWRVQYIPWNMHTGSFTLFWTWLHYY